MKQITGPVASKFVCPPHSTINVTEGLETLRQARGNKLVILEASLGVEGSLSTCISHYFFGQTHERKAVFESAILNSDSFTFATKRRLVRHIIEEQNYLVGSEKKQFDDLIRHMIALRNAFTHGALVCHGTQIFLQYFEGNPQKEELTDKYWTKTEATLHSAFQACHLLELKMGITTMQD